MKKYLAIPLAALAVMAACDDSSKAGLLAPEGGPNFHPVSGNHAHHQNLKPTITAPSAGATPTAGSVTVSWSAPSPSAVEQYKYQLTCTGAGCTPVAERTVAASVLSASHTLAAGDYTLSVKGTQAPNHSYEQVRTFTVLSSTPPPPPADVTPPTITCDVVNDAIWYGANVTVNCTAEDTGSGLAIAADASFSLSTNIDAGSENASALTGSKRVTDNAGNEATVGAFTFKVDRKAPTYTCAAAPTEWSGTEVSISCTGSDTGSGMNAAEGETLNQNGSLPFSLSTSVGAGNETASASTGTRQLTDNAGNHATAAAITGLKVDRKLPTLAPSVSPNPVLLNGSATASANATDDGSGIASQSCATVVTSSVGSHSVSCEARDNVGNRATGSASYSVHYDFAGFFKPIEMDKLNRAKAGSAIPVKFSLGGDQGLNIFAAGGPSPATISCTTGEDATLVSETVTAGSSSLQYDAVTGQYTYVWKTDAKWASSCRQLRVTLNDGSPAKTVNFQFTK